MTRKAATRAATAAMSEAISKYSFEVHEPRQER
jgi:hypothetical protein